MPRGKPTEKSIKSLIENNIKRGEENQKKWEAIKKEGKMECRRCNEIKLLELFSKRRDNSKYDVWETACIKCESERKNKVSQKRALRMGLEWNIRNILRSIKNGLTKRKLTIDIDIEYLVNLFNKQEGKCAYTGRKLVFDINNENRLSVDRYNSDKGYIKGNVRWVTWIVNNSKQDSTMEQYLKLCKDVLEYSNKNEIIDN